MNSRTYVATLASTALLAIATPAMARAPVIAHYDLPAQDLGSSLRDIGRIAHVEIMFSPTDVAGLSAPAIRGDLTIAEAINRLLGATGLVATYANGSVIIRGRLAAAGTEATDIIVTGSRIRGAPPTAPVTTMTSQDIRRAGQADLGEALRSSPLNFAGGQSPGIGTNQGAANVNANGASSVNLLGLGPNATLTLLNGSRLSYTGINAGVDISAIPAVAVDRVEIVTDGASAIYGADAVAGVVNVFLRRNYQGLSVQGTLGGATDGGDFQQHYSAVGGRTWKGGGVLAVYDYLANSAIAAGERSYATKMATDSTLYPRIGRNSGLVSLFQEVGALTANVDLLYKNGRQDIVQGYVTGQPHTVSGADARANTYNFVVAPTVTARLGAGWTARFVSSYGFDKSRINSNNFAANRLSSTSGRRYDNDALSVEINAEGPLFELPAGAVRAAVGGGYRQTGIELVSVTGGVTGSAFNRHRDNRFGYAEVYVPLVAPASESRFGQSLSLTGAFRYEANSGVGSVALPKAGFVYTPIAGITLKGSWGRSFRLPTLYQQYSGYSSVLLPVAAYARGFPTGSNFIVLVGAGPNMKPERSENWTLSAEFKPSSFPRFSGTISYFNFDYTDRVATPVTSTVGGLNNPLYANLVTLNPSPALQQGLNTGATIGLQNGTSLPYNPSTVVAIFDERDRNVARQNYHGLTASARYTLGNKDRQKLDLSLDGTWIESKQQLVAGLPYTPLAGTIFNPPHLKGRLGATYSTPRFSLSGFANVSSDLTDRRTAKVYTTNGPITFDLTSIVQAGGGFELGATINNLFNAKPPIIVTGSPYETTFDSTNFSPIGRFISISLRKAW
ncbi:TonB-dependent receptor [Sphingomonas sp. PL20]|uniref:TonB-dependent receptor n=1 Tax=Sphingomonas sp. PL20 TaxID=2760712 RepID=UPI002FF4009E